MKYFNSVQAALALSFLMISGIHSNATAQTQKGIDIEGEATSDQSGHSISMPDANTVAIGAPYNNGNGMDAGHVRVYTWNGTAWIQKGSDIEGEGTDDNSGFSGSMPDANTVAVGAPNNDGNGTDAGHARVYSWNGSSWVQKGVDINGENAGDLAGWCVDMPDANTLAVSAPYNDGNGTDAGHVRIYSWNGSAWHQSGQDINGENGGDWSGYSVSMPNANTIAIGAPNNNGTGAYSGHARVYSWNGSAWGQKGVDLNGENGSDFSGWSVSMPDANTLAIGAPYSDGNGTDAGMVRILSWKGLFWTQKGMDIDGEAMDDFSGAAVSMPDANTVAIGSILNDGNGTNSGQVRVYSWNSLFWTQKGTDINGEAPDNRLGFSLSMPDANTVGVSAPLNDGNGVDAGHVRVYEFPAVGVDENSNDLGIILFPNPSKDVLNLNFQEHRKEVRTTLYSVEGKLLDDRSFISVSSVSLDLNVPAGIYLLKVQSEERVTLLKVIRE